MTSDLEMESVRQLLVDVATDIWRLNSQTLANAGDVPPNVRALIERLAEDLTVNGLELVDPTGTQYDHNLNYQVVYVEPGDGSLFISETLSPGIRIGSYLIAKPKVCLSPHRSNER